MPVSVSLPKNLEALLEKEVSEGNYGSKSELLRDALRRHMERKGLLEYRSVSEGVKQTVKESRQSEGIDVQQGNNHEHRSTTNGQRKG